MKKHWVIGTGLLLLAGVAGFVGVRVDLNKETHETALYKDKYGKGEDEYVQQYLEWSKLPGDERLENQWGQGQYGGPEIQQRLKQQQPGRLKADLPELATGPKVPAVLADVLYGHGWRQAVEQYRKRTQMRDNIAVGSSLAALTGLIGFIVCTGIAVTQKFTDIAQKHRLQSKEHDTDQTEDTATETAPRGANTPRPICW